MARVALVGWPHSVAALIEPVLRADGHAVSDVPLDHDAVRALARLTPDVLVVDRHPYINLPALLADVRAQPALAAVPLVIVGPPEPVEVQGIEVVRQPGRALDLGALAAAVTRATGAYPG